MRRTSCQILTRCSSVSINTTLTLVPGILLLLAFESTLFPNTMFQHLRGSAYLKTAIPYTLKNELWIGHLFLFASKCQWNIYFLQCVILACSLSKPNMQSKLMKLHYLIAHAVFTCAGPLNNFLRKTEKELTNSM